MADISQVCKASGKSFIIDDRDQEFYNKIAPSFSGKTYPVLLPSLSPDERCRRRLAWQNMTHLYLRKCNATGKDVISNISPDKPYQVYDSEYWWSDGWDSREYGRDFDFSRTFFDQYNDLLLAVPQPNVGRNYLMDENSDYTNYGGGNKNCYLIFHADMNRDCMYSVGIKKCTNVLDALHVHGSELLYQCIDCRSCYDLKFSQDCENCSSSWFLKDCMGCKDCFGCVNLRQKQYHIYNKPVMKEEYEKFISEYQSGSFSTVQDSKTKFADFQKGFPKKATQGFQNDNCTGDRIYRCQNAQDCFDVQESRDMRYCHRIYNGPNNDVYDVNEYGMQIELVYEGLAVGINSQNIIAGMYVNEVVSSIYYGVQVHHAKNCCGCVSVTKGEYRILNKQYTREEYEVLVPKIIEHMKSTGEWGEFFPAAISPWGYNETVANDYFPMERDAVLAKGWKWKEKEQKDYLPQNYVIPDNIVDVKDDILQQVLACQTTGFNYRITKQELAFYRNMNLPIPREYFQERHKARFQQQNPRQLWDRQCAKCGKGMKTSYSPERPEVVYCEECYLAEIQ